MKLTGIYKITSPTNKVYIGQSTDINKRWKIHIGLYIENSKLGRSLLKYGFENHKFEIIEECNVEQLNEREIYWGIYYDVLGPNGLNLRLGDANGLCSEETKQKISSKKKDHNCYQNQNRNIKISNALKGRKIVWKKGKEKKGKKQQQNFKNNLKKLHNKPIIQYDKINNIIKEWPSILEASSGTNIHRENIGSVLRNISKTAGGFIWRYKEK